MNINIVRILEIIINILILVNLFTIKDFLLSVSSLFLLLFLLIIDFTLCIKKERQLEKINNRIKEGTENGLADLIELQFNVKEKGNIGKLARNLNSLLQEVKKVFWDIKENLFVTKISKSTLDNIQILMISYIQKVVNIGNVRTQMESICKRINDATNSTKLILGSIIELANQTNKEAAAIQQTSNALEKLLTTISDITNVTQDKQKMAEELKKIAKVGKEKVGKTTEIIQSINESTGEMLKIIEIINNIAESTNILSINAGIEAAHAGKEGKGFRVIADEIIKLVDSTKKNAGEISALLKDQVDKMTLALRESEVSGDVLNGVNKEVQNAADTWIEISEKTIEMSRGTQIIQETTDNMFEITRIVSESSETIKQSVEKINKEAAELDEATSKTLDILEKVTVTNEEAKKSTVTILQQLNEMTKFVSKLNKAIDFFNLGRRVYFLFSKAAVSRYAQAILQNEYEVYQTNNSEKLLKILKENTNSIVLINARHAPNQFVVSDYITSIRKLHDSNNISIGVIIHDKEKKKGQLPDRCDYLFLGKEAETGLGTGGVEKILAYIKMKRAKGLRKQVRVACSEQDRILVALSINNTLYTGKVQDISSGAIVARFPKEIHLESIKKKFNMVITIMGEEYNISVNTVQLRADNTFLIIFSDKIEKKVKNAIYEFIFKKLREQLDMEIAKLK